MMDDTDKIAFRCFGGRKHGDVVRFHPTMIRRGDGMRTANGPTYQLTGYSYDEADLVALVTGDSQKWYDDVYQMQWHRGVHEVGELRDRAYNEKV